MKIERFEDLLAWQEARGLTREVYALAPQTPLNRDFGLRDQLQRAAVSVMSNTADGFERTGRQEKLHFMNIARASCAEVKSLLYVCLDNRYLGPLDVTELQTRCTKIGRLLSGLIRSVATRSSSPSSGSGAEH
ncbi:MAG: four helix bundle protein [Verrucomicrobia bacterium]|nr:four helix bundle protein [Verrucomicrobiota bacterium]